MILEQFGAIVFVGDTNLQSIYNGFNILLRQDLARGSLATWDMPDDARSQCRCDNQFTEPVCSEYFVTSSGQVPSLTWSPGQGDPYICNRSTPHAFLQVNSSPAADEVVAKFNGLVSRAPRPAAVIHGLAPESVPEDRAVVSMLEFQQRASG